MNSELEPYFLSFNLQANIMLCPPFRRRKKEGKVVRTSRQNGFINGTSMMTSTEPSGLIPARQSGKVVPRETPRFECFQRPRGLGTCTSSPFSSFPLLLKRRSYLQLVAVYGNQRRMQSSLSLGSAALALGRLAIASLLGLRFKENSVHMTCGVEIQGSSQSRQRDLVI
jgi:hypothetical protein